MTKRETNNGVQDLRFFLSQPHPCGYLPQRQAVSLFTDPLFTIHSKDYSQLIDNGFRRSGPHFYRPECPNCNSCVPLRISVNSFKPNRSQRRTWKYNNDLEVRSHTPYSSPALFDLYKCYLNQRHPDGGMDNPKEDDFLNFLVCQGISTQFFEFYHRNQLMAVAVVDKLQQLYLF